MAWHYEISLQRRSNMHLVMAHVALNRVSFDAVVRSGVWHVQYCPYINVLQNPREGTRA